MGSLDGAAVAVGNLELMEDVLSNLPDDLEEQVAKRARRGTTVVLVAKGQRLLGWMEFSDRIRETSEAAVKRLKQVGINVVMLTGDREEVARTVADAVGITNVVAGVKPDQKAEHIRRLQEEGVVAMIGDGINDAAALTLANVGIAMGAGTDVAKEAGGIVLIRNDLRDAVDAIGLSRATMRKVWKCLGKCACACVVAQCFSSDVCVCWRNWLVARLSGTSHRAARAPKTMRSPSGDGR